MSIVTTKKGRRILIDGYFLGKPFGFGRFLIELCRALGQAQTGLEFVVAVPESVNEALLSDYLQLKWHRAPATNRIIWEQIAIPRLARRLACDLIHFPCNTTAGYTYGIPSVTTIHDIIFLEDRSPFWKPKAFVAEKYIRFSFKHFAKRSTSIISVSKTTQKLLAERGLLSRSIYNTADGFIATPVVSKHATSRRRYILHRGGSSGHRNSERVIEAFRAARGSLAGIDLKILGVPSEIANQWRVPGDHDIYFLPRLSDEELASLYAGSACVVVASLQEGFGLPIIEAFGFGVPVITSNIDPMREIAGDAALLIDPRSIVDISRAMVSVVADPELAQALRDRGRIRLQDFSSQRTAQQLLAVYEQDEGTKEHAIGTRH